MSGKTTYDFFSSARLTACCCLIISMFTQSTAGTFDGIDDKPGKPSENTGCETETSATDFGSYGTPTHMMDFGDIEMQTDMADFGDYKIETGKTDSDIIVIAIHGGKIERGTTELACALSSHNNYNYYSYQGVKSKENLALHVASDQFAEPTALKMVSESKTTLSIHGCTGLREFTYVGGLDTELGNKIKDALTRYGFTVLPAPEHLAGTAKNNIANRNRRGAGIQLEISKGLRARFLSGDNDSLKNYVLAISEAVNSI